MVEFIVAAGKCPKEKTIIFLEEEFINRFFIFSHYQMNCWSHLRISLKTLISNPLLPIIAIQDLLSYTHQDFA